MATSVWIYFAFLISLCLAVCSANIANLDGPDPKRVKMAGPFGRISGHRGMGRASGHRFLGLDEPQVIGEPCNYGYCGSCGCPGYGNSCNEGRTDVLYSAIRELTVAIKAKTHSNTKIKGGHDGGDDDATSFVKQP